MLSKVSLKYFMSSGIDSVIPVRIGPGPTALTVIPVSPSSTARDLVRPTTPCDLMFDITLSTTLDYGNSNQKAS